MTHKTLVSERHGRPLTFDLQYFYKLTYKTIRHYFNKVLNS